MHNIKNTLSPACEEAKKPENPVNNGLNRTSVECVSAILA